MTRNRYYENIWKDLEAKVESRVPYFSNFERRLLTYNTERGKWDLEDEGVVSLPIDSLNLNPSLEKLHGGMLTFQISSRDGLEVYGQSDKVLRIPTARRLNLALVNFIVNDDHFEIPILYSNRTLPIPKRKEFQIKNVFNYNRMYLALNS